MWQKILIFLVATCQQWSLNKGDTSCVSPSACTEPPVCPCEYRYNPVCGSDNVTYFNECVLNCIKQEDHIKGYPVVKKVYSGECKSLVCQILDLSVCTLDGLTYANECELAVANIKRIRQKKPIIYLAYRAECNGPHCNCTSIAAPVCGGDDIVYRNECVLDCASENNVDRGLSKISIKNNGACLDGCLCPKRIEQVCGSDGQEYNNICELQCVNKRLSYSKNKLVKVADRSVCEGFWCTADYDPICGSDGRSYSNECQLNFTAKRENNPNLIAVSKGLCSQCDCNDDDIPVCGTDHVTYRNECHMRCANKAHTKYISLYHYGACLLSKDCDCSYCPGEYKPVCGSDNQTYWNFCWLLCHADCLKTAGEQGIWQTSDEACCI